jgi:hypothetical protein
MPRTLEEIARTDRLAAECGYVPPPLELEPTGMMGGDPAWSTLGEWFDEQGVGWSDGILIYISRRWDQSIEHVYMATDNWAKNEIARRDRLEDPDAVVSFN